MTKMTEDELMRAYDPTLRTEPTPIEPPQPSVQPRMLHRGARVCLRGHLLPHGGRCSTCRDMAVKKVLDRRSTRKTRCTKGHQLTANNVVETKRNRANGTSYVQRSCLTCMRNREVAKGLKHPQSSRFHRAQAKARVEEIDNYILTFSTRLDTMTTYDKQQWRSAEAVLVREKDDLVRRFHFS